MLHRGAIPVDEQPFHGVVIAIPRSCRTAANVTAVTKTGMAWSISASVGKVGANLIFESFGSRPYGNVAPAGVSLTPASPASRMIAPASPGGDSKEMK